jgi:hypothetical protein
MSRRTLTSAEHRRERIPSDPLLREVPAQDCAGGGLDRVEPRPGAVGPRPQGPSGAQGGATGGGREFKLLDRSPLARTARGRPGVPEARRASSAARARREASWPSAHRRWPACRPTRSRACAWCASAGCRVSASCSPCRHRGDVAGAQVRAASLGGAAEAGVPGGRAALPALRGASQGPRGHHRGPRGARDPRRARAADRAAGGAPGAGAAGGQNREPGGGADGAWGRTGRSLAGNAAGWGALVGLSLVESLAPTRRASPPVDAADPTAGSPPPARC